jgi:chromosome segregation ATPase
VYFQLQSSIPQQLTRPGVALGINGADQVRRKLHKTTPPITTMLSIILTFLVPFLLHYIYLIRSEVHFPRTERTYLLVSIAILTTSNASLTSQLSTILDSLKNTQLKLERACSDHEDTETNLDAAECRVEELGSQMKEMEEVNGEMRKRVKALETEVGTRTKHLAVKTYDLETREDIRVEEQRNTTQYSTAMRAKLSTASAQVKSLKSELADSSAALDKAGGRLEKSEQKRAKLKAHVEGLGSKLQPLREEREGLVTRVGELEEYVDESESESESDDDNDDDREGEDENEIESGEDNDADEDVNEGDDESGDHEAEPCESDHENESDPHARPDYFPLPPCAKAHYLDHGLDEYAEYISSDGSESLDELDAIKRRAEGRFREWRRHGHVDVRAGRSDWCGMEGSERLRT